MADQQRKWNPNGPGRPPRDGKCRAKRATPRHPSLAPGVPTSHQASEVKAGPSGDSTPLPAGDPVGLGHASTGAASMTGRAGGNGGIPALESFIVDGFRNISVEMPGQPPADQGLNPTQLRGFQPTELLAEIPLLQHWVAAGQQAPPPMQAPQTIDLGSYVGVLTRWGRFGGCSATIDDDPGTVASTVQDELLAQKGLHHLVSPAGHGQRPYITLVVHLKPGQQSFSINCFVVPSHSGTDLVLCPKDARTIGLSSQGPGHWPAGNEGFGVASQYSSVGSWDNVNPSLQTPSYVATSAQPWSAGGTDPSRVPTASHNGPSSSPWAGAPPGGFTDNGYMTGSTMADGDADDNATSPPPHEGGGGPHQL